MKGSRLHQNGKLPCGAQAPQNVARSLKQWQAKTSTMLSDAWVSDSIKLQATHSTVEHRPLHCPIDDSPPLVGAADDLFPELPSLSHRVHIPQVAAVEAYAQPGQTMETFAAACGMAENVRHTCMFLDSASRVVSSRIQALDSVLEWADDLAQFSVAQQMRIAHARDESFAAGLGVNGGLATAAFAGQAGRAGTLHFKQEPAPQHLQQAAATACIEAATACIQADCSAEVPATTVPEAPAPVGTTESTEVEKSAAASVSSTAALLDAHLAAILEPSGTSNVQILHPGVQGSSSVHIDRFEDQQAAMVTVRAAVQLTPCTAGSGDACVPVTGKEPSMDVAVAFASSVAAQAAVSSSKDLLDFASPVVDGTAASTTNHAQILSTLQHGRITRVRERTVSQFSHESFIVELEHPAGHKCKAMIKPRERGDFDGWHRTPIERVAYLLNLLLGLDYVPPTVYRQDLQVDGQVYPHGGAVIFFVDNLMLLENVPENDWGCCKEGFLSDTRVLDILLHNTDRHIGHFAWGNHWAVPKKLPVLIDHAAGFRDGASVCMQQDNAFRTGQVAQINAKTYLHLKLLDAAVIAKRMHGILTPGEIISIIERRDGILRFLNQLVLEDGIENVLL